MALHRTIEHFDGPVDNEESWRGTQTGHFLTMTQRARAELVTALQACEVHA